MKNTMIPFLILILGALLCGSLALAQDANTPDAEGAPVPPEKFEKYEDFIVKGYSISFSAGHFLGTTYLDNQLLDDTAFYALGANDILRYHPNDEDGFGDSLPQSTEKDPETDHFVYDAAQKEVHGDEVERQGEEVQDRDQPERPGDRVVLGERGEQRRHRHHSPPFSYQLRM